MMSVPLFKVLRKGAIYRINYTQWKTNIRPIIFVLYAGPMKVHALSINSPFLTAKDRMTFIFFLKKMLKIRGSENYRGSLLYKIIKTYIRDVVKKSYRTYKTMYINKIALVSRGIVSEKYFTDLEYNMIDPILYNEANNQPFMRTFKFFNQKNTVPKNKVNPIYKPK
jgi:hypothetical protein